MFELGYRTHNSNINIQQKSNEIHRYSQNPSIITTRYHLSDALAILERIKQVNTKNKAKNGGSLKLRDDIEREAVREELTSASLLLRQLVDEDSDADGVAGLRGDEEVVVVVHDEPQEHKGGHAGDHAQKRLHLRGLPLHPSHNSVDLPLRC